MPINPPEPLFILTPPASDGALVAAMLGRHVGLHDLPELDLLIFETVGDWLVATGEARLACADGVLRTVARLFLGEESPATVCEARGWLRRRSHYTTSYLVEKFAGRVQPGVLVEHSTSHALRKAWLRCLGRHFPGGRFLHLVRHPRVPIPSFDKSLEMAGEATSMTRRALARWPPARFLRSRPNSSRDDSALESRRLWLHAHANIVDFLGAVSPDRALRIRSEDVRSNPAKEMRGILDWLQLPAAAEIIGAMMHPERSPYAVLGSAAAPGGNDRYFLESPSLASEAGAPTSVFSGEENPEDSRDVERLAREFGYS